MIADILKKEEKTKKKEEEEEEKERESCPMARSSSQSCFFTRQAKFHFFSTFLISLISTANVLFVCLLEKRRKAAKSNVVLHFSD